MSGHRLAYALLTIAAMAIAVLVFNLVLFSAQQPDDAEDAAQPRTNAEFYVVREGDALSVIAERTGVESERIEELNPRLDPLALRPGQRIRLRPPTAAELARRRARRRAQRRRTSYVLKQGDVLSEVASRNGVELTRLLELNPKIKRPDSVLPGQRIRLR